MDPKKFFGGIARALQVIPWTAYGYVKLANSIAIKTVVLLKCHLNGVSRRFGSFGAGGGIRHAGRRAILAREELVEQLVGKRRLLPYFAAPQQLRDHDDPHLPYDCVSRFVDPPVHPLKEIYSHSCLLDILVLVRPF